MRRIGRRPRRRSSDVMEVERRAAGAVVCLGRLSTGLKRGESEVLFIWFTVASHAQHDQENVSFPPQSKKPYWSVASQ